MSSRAVPLSDKEMNAIVESLSATSGVNPNHVVLINKLQRAFKRITVASAKQKGMNGQHWIADRIAEIFNIEWKQSDDQSLIAVRPSGQHGTDIILRGDMYKRFPWDVEAKWSESLNLSGTIEQAEANTKPGRNWLIVHKRKSFQEPIVIMKWSAFENMTSDLDDYRNP